MAWKLYIVYKDLVPSLLTESLCPQIQLAEVTAEKHKAHEHLKASADQHQRTLGAYQQRVSALQEECREARVRPRVVGWG